MKYRIMETMANWKPIGFVFVSDVIDDISEAQKILIGMVREKPNRWLNIVTV